MRRDQPFRRPRRVRITALCASIATAVAAVLLLQTPASAGDAIYEPYGAWNGKKIYLSPARHSDTGSRGECKGTSENEMAYNTAWHATNGNHYGGVWDPDSIWRNLRSRGYMVRIGRGTVSSAVSNSNAWGATLHIPIHSNADVANQCSRTDAGRFGTVVIYESTGPTAGEGLALKLSTRVGQESPGTRDYACHVSSTCTRFTCLAELCQTKATSAYLEAEFHTWNRGVDFVRAGDFWAWRIGWAVDVHLGYPRAVDPDDGGIVIQTEV